MNQEVTSNSEDRQKSGKSLPPSLIELGRRVTTVLDRFETRRKAAKIADRSVDQLAKYEKGKAEPSFRALARLCLASGVRLEWLATGEGEMLVPSALPAEQVRESEPWPGYAQGKANPHELTVLGDAVRVTDEVLRRFGIRDIVDSDQLADLVRLVFQDLARGGAEDAASASLERILTIAKQATPR